MKGKNFIKVAGLLDVVLGALVFIIPFMSIPGLIIMTFGAVLVSMTSEEPETIAKHKVLLIIMGILNLSFNVISAVLIFISLDELNYNVKDNGENAPPKEENKEAKKIDMLLKLGVGMVFISGILFATTSWEFINDIFKAFALIIFGFLFLGLSYFTETKLKLEKSSYVYWLLSMSFFTLTIVGIEYFGVFGSFLTFTGEGKYLAYFVAFLTFGLLAIATQIKYKKDYLMYVSYLSIVYATHNLLMQINPNIVFSIIVLSILALLTNIIIEKESKLNNISKLTMYLLGTLTIVKAFGDISSTYKVFSIIVGIINMTYISYTNKNDVENVFNLIVTYFLLFVILTLDIDLVLKVLLTFTIGVLFTYIVNIGLISYRKLYKEENNVLFTILALVTYAFIVTEHGIVALIMAVAYLGICLASKYELFNSYKSIMLDICLPATFIFIVYSIESILNVSSIYLFTSICAITSVIYMILHYMLKEEKEKKKYIIYGVILSILSILGNIDTESSLLALFPVLTSAYLLAYKNNDSDKRTIKWPYILFLFSLYIPFIGNNVLGYNETITTAIGIGVLAIIMFITKSDIIRLITELFIVLPILKLIGLTEFEEVLDNISTSILILYILFLVVRHLINDPKAKNIVTIVVMTIALLNMMFEPNIYYGLYIGIIGIITLIIGYSNDDYNLLFKYSFVIIILNIIVQLFDLWTKIPFWLYLLVCGLGIIGFVTYKEMKKMK